MPCTPFRPGSAGVCAGLRRGVLDAKAGVEAPAEERADMEQDQEGQGDAAGTQAKHQPHHQDLHEAVQIAGVEVVPSEDEDPQDRQDEDPDQQPIYDLRITIDDWGLEAAVAAGPFERGDSKS